jgi:hypothetical protein
MVCIAAAEMHSLRKCICTHVRPISSHGVLTVAALHASIKLHCTQQSRADVALSCKQKQNKAQWLFSCILAAAPSQYHTSARRQPIAASAILEPNTRLQHAAQQHKLPCMRSSRVTLLTGSVKPFHHGSSGKVPQHAAKDQW